MLKKLIGKLIAWKVGKPLLVPLGRGYGALKGKKTEILLVVLGVVFVLEVLGLVPEGAADQLKVVLGAAALPTFLEKVRDHEDVVREVLRASEEAAKPEEQK